MVGHWRLLAPAICCWVLAAALIHVPGAARWVAGSALLAAIAAVVFVSGRNRWRRIVGLCLLGSALVLMLSARIDAAERIREHQGAAIEHTLAAGEGVAVRLAGYPESIRGLDGRERGWVRATANRVPLMLWLPEHAEQSWAPGTTIVVSGSAQRGGPESQAALEIRVKTMSESAQETWSLPSITRQWSSKLRHDLSDAAAQQPGAALVPGFAVGDTSLVSDDVDALMKEASLTHLTAVSGANCALITGVATWAASWCGVGRRGRQLIAAGALGAFVFIVGPDPSVQRAAIMAAVMLISNFGGKRGRSLPALGVAIIALLLADPWQAVGPGFALSVAATGGILLGVPAVTSWFCTRLRLPRWLALMLSVTTVAQVACAPLLLLLQPGLPAAGIVANLVAAPAAPVGTGLGLAAMFALQAAPTVGAGVVWAASWAARWVEAAGELALALPGGRWYWPGGWGGAVVLGAVELLLLGAWALGTGRIPAFGSGASGPGGAAPWGRRVRLPRRTALVVQVCAGLAAGVTIGMVLVVPIAVRVGVPKDWVVVACDVGQGDAILLRNSREPDEVMLVDVGDDAQALTECLQLFGVRRVSVLVLTHDDRDHVGAVAQVLRKSDFVLVAAPTTDQAENRPLIDEIVAAQRPYAIGAAGMGGAGALKWKVLGPEAHAPSTTTNAASLVIAVEVDGKTVVLLGDTGEDEQRTLLRHNTHVRADVVKVAHHGSRDQFVQLYTALGAEVALVSVGHNRYGHPNADLLTSLIASGTTPLRTDELGSVALSVRGGAIEAWSSRNRSLNGASVGHSTDGGTG